MTRVVRDMLRARATASPNAQFVKCGGDWLTAAETDYRAERVAAGLTAIGVAPGDRVALLMPNRQEMLELFFGCARLGAIQVPLNSWLKGEFLRHQLADCGATTLVSDAAGLRAAAPLLDGSSVRQLVLLDEAEGPVPDLPVINYQAMVRADGAAPRVTINQSDPLSIMYTSGTTGMPKGCVLANGYYTAAGPTFGRAGLIVEGERIFTAFPLFHAGGQVISLMAALANGGSVCYEQQFSASAFLGRARAENATMLWGVGLMGAALLAQPPSDDDRAHPFRLAAWVPMSPEVQTAFEERFATPVTAEMFGQTECLPITLSSVAGPRNRASLGLPLDNLIVAVVDDAGEPVDSGQPGEIVVKPREADVMFAGYWDRETETAQALGDDWHHTGDYGRADADGFLTFVDRKKDAVRRRGENVSSFELEAAIMRHPAVARVAVTAVPSPLGEDDIKASIVPAEGAELDVEDLFAFFKEHLPYFAIPRYVDPRQALPVNAMDRVMKHVLRGEGVTDSMADLDALGLVVGRGDRRG